MTYTKCNYACTEARQLNARNRSTSKAVWNCCKIFRSARKECSQQVINQLAGTQPWDLQCSKLKTASVVWVFMCNASKQHLTDCTMCTSHVYVHEWVCVRVERLCRLQRGFSARSVILHASACARDSKSPKLKGFFEKNPEDLQINWGFSRISQGSLQFSGVFEAFQGAVWTLYANTYTRAQAHLFHITNLTSETLLHDADVESSFNACSLGHYLHRAPASEPDRTTQPRDATNLVDAIHIPKV